MDQPEKTLAPAWTDAPNWIGRIIVAVIIGEAIWSLIVSLMTNLVVPWLGDVMGQSAGLPTSFTQRPYNYPDLFVSVVEFCIAGIVAAILNHFFQRPRVKKAMPGKRLAQPAPVEPARMIPRATAEMGRPAPNWPAPIQPATNQAAITPSAMDQVPSPAATPKPEGKADSVVVLPAPAEETALVAEPVTASATSMFADSAPTPVSSAPVSSTPVSSTPGAEPRRPDPIRLEAPKPKKPKAVYYNIVGEPVPSDED